MYICVASESDSGELPAFFRLKEIAIGAPDVSTGGGAGTTAQDVLVAHEFAVVFPERSWSGTITGVRRVGAARPFPNVAEHLLKSPAFRRLGFQPIIIGRMPMPRSRMKQFRLDEISFDWTTQRSA